MIIRDEGKRVHVQCDDLTEVAKWLRETTSSWNYQSSLSTGRGDAWDLGVGLDGALRLAETGWSEGAKNLSDKLAAHMPERDHVDSWRYDVAGELPDIGRFLVGDPSCMKRHGHPKGHKPIISILVNLCCSGGVPASHYANYGAALCSVIDQLENSGRRVELSVAWISEFYGDARFSGGWTVKHAEDALDLAAVAFSLAHPAASRRIGFAMVERTRIRPSMSYGSVVTGVEEDWIDPLPGTYCLQGVGFGGGATLQDALVRVVREINKAAGEELVTVEG